MYGQKVGMQMAAAVCFPSTIMASCTTRALIKITTIHGARSRRSLTTMDSGENV